MSCLQSTDKRYSTTWHESPEDCNFDSCCCDKLTFHCCMNGGANVIVHFCVEVCIGTFVAGNLIPFIVQLFVLM